jgi:polysaccharide export outer membrane protein
VFARATASLCILLVAAGCGLPPLSPGTPGQVGLYRVAPPDVLAIIVSPAPAVTREVTVRPDGRISLELLGDVEVEGKTIEEIKRDIENRLREYIVQPEVMVDLIASRSRFVYVFGQVRKPGSFALVGRVTAIEALAQAGGGTLFANLNASRVARLHAPEGEGETGAFRVRYKDIIERADPATNYELRQDDIIWVPPTLSARIGFFIQRLFFPLTAIFGVGRSAGGAAAAF